ncbi:MAG: hypothetical protein H6713_17385 [Myxococcales bacterium]|nr:hypothetical protein [Myxococcales bacterium]
MKRALLIAALGLGTVVGFGSGLMSLHHHHRAQHDEMMQRLSEVCVDAAFDARGIARAGEPAARLDGLAAEVAARCAAAAR